MGVACINDLTDTWNSAITTYQSIKLDVTDTASCNASTYAQFVGSCGEAQVTCTGFLDTNYNVPFNCNGMGVGYTNDIDDDTFFGGSALNYLQDPALTYTGQFNTALGFVSLYNNQSRDSNAAIGGYSLGNDGLACLHCESTGFGFCTGNYKSGCRNVLIGFCAGDATTNNCNVFIGHRTAHVNCASAQICMQPFYTSLITNTSPIYNMVIGCKALCYSTSTHSMMAIGHSALQCDQSSNVTTAVGTAAGAFMTAGSSFLNVYVGYCAGARVNGDYNTMVGTCAGYKSSALDTNCNTYVGTNTGGVNQTTVRNNEVSIGHCSATLQSTNCHHRTTWGNSSNNVCNCIYAAWSNVSDCRDKTEIKSLPENYGLTFINRLKPSKFKWDVRDSDNKGTKFNYGFIAQDIKETIDDLGISFDALGYNDIQDAYRLTYTDLISPLTLAVQQLACRIDALED